MAYICTYVCIRIIYTYLCIAECLLILFALLPIFIALYVLSIFASELERPRGFMLASRQFVKSVDVDAKPVLVDCRFSLWMAFGRASRSFILISGVCCLLAASGSASSNLHTHKYSYVSVCMCVCASASGPGVICILNDVISEHSGPLRSEKYQFHRLKLSRTFIDVFREGG